MTQFYIVEIKQMPSGEYEHNVFWEYDNDPDIARLKGESKYHALRSVAATSNTMSHAAIMFSTEGFPVLNQCYKHQAVQQTPAADTGDEPAEQEEADEPVVAEVVEPE